MEEGKVIISLVKGVEGIALYVGDENTGYRLAGPKPWGGGTTVYSFKVDIEELRKELVCYSGNEKE